MVKLLLNLILVGIPWIGINGAEFSSVIAHMITCTILWIMLKKYIKLNLSFLKFVLKPVLATLIMGICTYFTYLNLLVIISAKLATIIAIIVAVIIYILAILLLRIFSKEEIEMLPYGEKINKVIFKIGIYR